MDDEPEIPVFTLVQKNAGYLAGDGEQEQPQNEVFYLTLNETVNGENELEESTSYLVDGDALFDTSTVFSSEIKIVTVGDEQYFYIPTNEDETEITVQPQLITGQITPHRQDDSSVKDDSLSEMEFRQDSEDSLLKIEPFEMMTIENITNDSSIESKKKFKCLYKGCEKSYSSSQHLTVHMRNHVNSKPFVCTYDGCGKKFSTNYSLTAHWRTHTGEKPYTCQFCDKSFKTSGDLMKHVRIHTGEKPFACPIEGCGKSFTTSNIRKVHVRSHTGERPYVCDYPNCGKAFASSTNHRNHARIHSGEKPYACNVKGCDKKFTEYSSLYKHQAVHQVEKPFECDYCKQKFKTEYTLNVHRKVRHGVLISPEGIQVLDLASVGLVSLNS